MRTSSMFLRAENVMRLQTLFRSRPGALANRDNSLLLSALRGGISDILCAVRNSLFVVVFVAAVFASQPLLAVAQASPAPQQETPPPAVAQPSAPSGPLIVLDPAHGGTDSGARGEAIVEKDVVLQIARTVRAELERQGYRVIMTRNDDSNPSYDDRAAVANAHRDAILISLHVSSTGVPGTVRAYYTQFGTVAAPIPVAGVANSKTSNPPANQLAVWEEAQRPYLDASRRLADLIQGEMAQAFSGSPPTSTGVPVRAIRSVAVPAVAVEISSVSTPTPDLLTASAGPLGAAIARAIAAFHQTIPGGAR
jgi:N-acetylmuramoyl-L-alanine amidase